MLVVTLVNRQADGTSQIVMATADQEIVKAVVGLIEQKMAKELSHAAQEGQQQEGD